jgi:hypothetical protein
MAPRKAPKKNEDAQEGDIISDTTPHAIDSIKSWTQISDLLEYEFENAHPDSENHFRDIAESELHKIVARPRLVAYTDMISWALDKVDIPTRSILNEQGAIVGSFRPEHIQVMYKLSPNHKHTFNAEFLAEFQRKECIEADQTYPDMIRGWARSEAKFRADAHGIYATASLNEYMVYIAIMLCRLFGRKDPCHFHADWVPFLEEASEGNGFNWHKILSDNLTQEILNYKAAKSKGQPTTFYMSAYIMDAICFMTPFPLMNWSWSISCPEPIHKYHSALWEENAKDAFYEVCHFIIIPMHKMFFGCEPPRISDAIIESLKAVADWFIEEIFSYIRVYGCSIPPHALPKFLPDRLVCREVAYQIVKGGVGLELKALQKKSWPSFPVHIGKFSLSNLGHSKVEAESLEEVKLVDIEHRKYDPYQVISRHFIHCNLKAYEHEVSIYDDIFKDVKSYEEVLNRVQALPPDSQTGFTSFQSHRRSCLPKSLQGEISTPSPEQEGPPPGFETNTQDKENNKGKLKNTEIPSQDTEGSQTKESGTEKRKELETIPEIMKNVPEKIGGTTSTELGSPITSLTPLQSTFGTPHEGVLYVSDLEPISRDEIPPSDYFFSKKRRAVLKQEIHPRGEGMIKKHRVIIDGKKLKDGEFATELAGTMGAIASTNMYSVGNLTTMLEQKDQTIIQLQDKLKENERNISWGIQKGLEQARLKDMQEIQKMNKDLEEAKHIIQVTQEQVRKLGEENKHLQDKIISITNQVVELENFRTQALEIYLRIEEEQQKVFLNLEVVQNYFQETNKSLENVFQKEREAKAARTTFQKAVAFSSKEEVGKIQKLSISEQVKGDIILKVWEANLAEYKRITREVNDDCQGIFDLLERASLNIGTDDCSGLLGEINIAKHQLRFKEELEEMKTEISKIKLINITEINKWMVTSNLKLKTIKFTEKMIENRLPELQKRFFLFEANEIPDAPRTFVKFLGKCVQCIEAEKGSSSTQA